MGPTGPPGMRADHMVGQLAHPTGVNRASALGKKIPGTFSFKIPGIFLPAEYGMRLWRLGY